MGCSECANGNAGGVCLVALTASECPTNPDAFGNCAASTPVGGLCEADGELSTDIYLDNCDDDYDFYKVAECHDESRLPVLVSDLSLASHEAFHCCCGSMLPPPPPPPSPPFVPVGECIDDYAGLATNITGGCAGWTHICPVGSHWASDLIRGLCPKSCGRCATFCLENDEALLQFWKAYNPGTYRQDLTCETAHAHELMYDGMILTACPMRPESDMCDVSRVHYKNSPPPSPPSLPPSLPSPPSPPPSPPLPSPPPPPPSPPPLPPSPSPPATNCPEYWERQGCGWTYQYSCPNSAWTGSVGVASKQGDNDLAYECCCEQDTPETTPDRCYDDPTYRETTLTGMNCHEWAHTDTNHDYYADCSQTDALYLTATSCSTGTHPTAAQLVDSYPCEEGGYGPLDSTTRTGNGHLDHSLPQCNHKDDPDFRLRGFSCAQWGVPLAGNGVVECMASNDQHWIDSPEGYTQAELDSLRTNCPATCARDATGTLDNVGTFTVYAGMARQDTCAFYGGDHDGNGVVDCLASQAATRIGEGTGITQSDLDAIRKSCPETCGQCAEKHFYYPASLMNEVRKHCPAACSSSCSGTPFG